MPSRKKKSRKPVKDTTSTNLISQQQSRNVDCFEGEHLSFLLNSMRNEIESERHSNKTLLDKLWLKQQFAVGVNEAVLVSWDCNPRWLIKHLPSFAASRNVPIIHVKDHKQGSVRLGELIGLRTTIAIGVKAKGSGINRLVETSNLHAEQELTPAWKRNVALT
ncbi:hypothetical protein Dimus_028666 [Dionaea muscipula]